MLITFKSKAAADIIMYKEHAQPILDLWHKQPDRGVITSAEIPGAIAALETGIREAQAEPEPAASQMQAGREIDEDRPAANQVPFAVRVFPLLEMLRAAQKQACEVVWGV